MRWNDDAGHPLRKLFSGTVEQVFMSDLGICDHRLTDYLGDVLCEFVHVDQIFRLRTVDGAAIREISRMEAEAHLDDSVSASQRMRIVNRYIGDFTLFWTGVYPEQLRPRVACVDRLGEYVLQGRRSYGIASELTSPNDQPPASLLRLLSDQFEACVHGLRRVRDEWERASTQRP